MKPFGSLGVRTIWDTVLITARYRHPSHQNTNEQTIKTMIIRIEKYLNLLFMSMMLNVSDPW